MIFFLFLISRVFANDISGNWRWINSNAKLDLAKFTIREKDSKIEGTLQSNCGLGSISGEINKNEIGIDLNIETNSDEDCPTSIQLVAYCGNEDCSVINGSWYDSSHLVGHLTWVKEDKDFYISSPKLGWEFSIDPQLNMPSMSFLVASKYPPAPLQWSLKNVFHWLRGRTYASLPPVITNTNDYIPDISSWGKLGGNVTTTVIYNPKKNSKIAIGNYRINGTNPGKFLIEQASQNAIQLKIACVESSFRQFEAEREGGEGFPLIGKNSRGKKVGGVGIMQVRHNPIIPETVWNWRSNLSDGLNMYYKFHYYATRFHVNERIRLNAERKLKGLPSCPKNIPSPLTAEQLLRDSIRRYNYGVEYRWEPRDSKDCQGQWIIEPSCKRHPRNGCDKDYVNKVLQCNII